MAKRSPFAKSSRVARTPPKPSHARLENLHIGKESGEQAKDKSNNVEDSNKSNSCENIVAGEGLRDSTECNSIGSHFCSPDKEIESRRNSTKSPALLINKRYDRDETEESLIESRSAVQQSVSTGDAAFKTPFCTVQRIPFRLVTTGNPNKSMAWDYDGCTLVASEEIEGCLGDSSPRTGRNAPPTVPSFCTCRTELEAWMKVALAAPINVMQAELAEQRALLDRLLKQIDKRETSLHEEFTGTPSSGPKEINESGDMNVAAAREKATSPTAPTTAPPLEAADLNDIKIVNETSLRFRNSLKYKEHLSPFSRKRPS